MRLYLDDVQGLFDIVAGLGGTVKCETDELSDIKCADELAGVARAELKGFKMSATDAAGNRVCTLTLANPSAFADGKPTEVRVADGSDLAQQGAMSEIRSLLHKRRRRVPPKWVGWLALAFFFGVAAYPSRYFAHDSRNAWQIAGLLVYLVWPAVGLLRLAARRSAMITPAWRRDAPTFFARNRDAILVNLGTTLVGVVIGFALGRL